MQVTIGGNRLGSGKKMKTEIHGFERSSHDLSRSWRSTMSPGTLVPFLKLPMLPGDTFDIELNAGAFTHPTIGPLFGSYKLQLDVFRAPIRLYQSALHNNRGKIGLDMGKIKLPKFNFQKVQNAEIAGQADPDNYLVNPSSLLHYLGFKGSGIKNVSTSREVKVNAVPLLAYWDIYKNYYANQQEQKGAVIDITSSLPAVTLMNIDGNVITTSSSTSRILTSGSLGTVGFDQPITPTALQAVELDMWDQATMTRVWTKLEDVFQTIVYLNPTTVEFKDPWPTYYNPSNLTQYRLNYANTDPLEWEPQVNLFDLANLDTIKDKILATAPLSEYIISPTDTTIHPVNACLRGQTSASMELASSRRTQQGLGVKTYQNDIFNNWLNKEWLDNTSTGINAITAVDTSAGSFTIDSLNLANKVFMMLNRVALSGGTYRDWIKVNWDYDFLQNAESPIYEGGLSKEIVFEEIISTAEAGDGNFNQPLGTLAGKGRLSQKHKGGTLVVKADEHSYLMGIVSITPRIGYSQGNDWDYRLDSMNDFHKPMLDGIGFQDLLQEQQAWWGSIHGANVNYYSTGKQPAWINYMTAVDENHGNFAIKNNQMFMVLDRRYENPTSWSTPTIKDNTTYVDPNKFNFTFADTSPSAQNFWVEIHAEITARRKMSAKIMPNL